MSGVLHHGFLLKELVRRDFRGRYAGSLFGAFWSFAQPLWLLALYSLVFSTVMRISLVGERSENFGIWMFCGLLPWMALQESITRSATVISDQASLVKKLRFPSEILVLSIVISALLHEAIAAAIFVVVLAAMGELAGWSLGWLLLAVPLQVGLALGIGLLMASVNVFFRDAAQLLGMLMSAWFFLTPIVYPLSLVEEAGPGLRRLLELNPLTTLVETYRASLLGGGVDGPLLAGLGQLTVLAAVVLVLGLWVFRRLRETFVDEI